MEKFLSLSLPPDIYSHFSRPLNSLAVCLNLNLIGDFLKYFSLLFTRLTFARACVCVSERGNRTFKYSGRVRMYELDLFAEKFDI